MKTNNCLPHALKCSLPLLTMLVLFSGCQFSKGVKKDLKTGLSASYNGFALDDIYLADENGTRLNTNEIPMGFKVLVVATGVDYFAEKNSRVFPGCRIILTDKKQTEILNLPDAFADMDEGIDASKARVLQAQLNTGAPMVIGGTYHLAVRFYDKNKPGNEILANVDVTMKE